MGVKKKVPELRRTTLLADIVTARSRAKGASENGGDYTAKIQASTDMVILDALQWVIDNHDQCPALLWYMAVSSRIQTVFQVAVVVAVIGAVVYIVVNNVKLP